MYIYIYIHILALLGAIYAHVCIRMYVFGICMLMLMYMYVCMYMCMYVYVCMYPCINILRFTYACMVMKSHIHFVYPWICMQAYIFKFTRANLGKHTYIIRKHAYIVNMNDAYIYKVYIYIYIYIYI